MRAGVRFDDGPTFLDRVAHQLNLYDPAITAVQLNLLGSHDMPRILTICGGDRAAVRMATLLQLTLPGAPCIYYGDEIGMAGGHDPYCRGAFPTDEADWDQELRAYVRGLARLRHEPPGAPRRGVVAGGSPGTPRRMRAHDDGRDLDRRAERGRGAGLARGDGARA